MSYQKVWHSGTLASVLVGSTRRVTVTEVETLAAEHRDDNASTDSHSWWWDVDTGGRVMVREMPAGGGGGACDVLLPPLEMFFF